MTICEHIPTKGELLDRLSEPDLGVGSKSGNDTARNKAHSGGHRDDERISLGDPKLRSTFFGTQSF